MKIGYVTDKLDSKFANGKVSLKIIELAEHNFKDLKTIVIAFKDNESGRRPDFVFGTKLGFLLNYFKMRNLLRDCDIVHAVDGFPSGVMATLLIIGRKQKLIITGIGSGAIQMFDHKAYSLLLCWAYRRADCVVAISHFIATEIKNNVSGINIEVINLGVDLADYAFDSQMRIDDNILDKKPYILTVGMIKKRKGYHVSIPAFAKISKMFPDLNYVIVGLPLDKQYYDELHGLVKKEGVGDKVFFYDFVSHEFLCQLYQNAELFTLLPQDDKKDVEGFGLVFLEAAAFGLPIVAGQGSGADDAVLDNKNGLMVEASNIDAASEAMAKILGDNDLRARFKVGSYNFAKKMSWENVGAQYAVLYKSLISQ